MMERKTQRELIKLLLRLSDTMRQLDFGDNEQRGLAVDILKIIRDKCQRSFSEKRRAYYASSLDELLQILIHTDWQSMGSVEYRQSVRWCRDIVLEITNVLRNEKEIKKEIVFLPYKASMWDSLESVWKAAYEDKENCNTYVIPIPYANRNPDGTVSKWHCERDEYPNYVPTLDWNEYSWAKLREMHPDVIFIHNPYDNHNAVTSIDSQYYSDCLKKCTDKLVYVPYAVEEEIQPGNEVAENAIEHRVLLPVFFYADLIIAQSEDMRQAWINILTRRTNMNNRAYWEKRILGLGSPKIDKVLTSKKEDFEMPEKWKKLIGNKKVILYITSIAPMLQNSDKVCAKLRYVFDTFRNQDDVVLWWRPHPLMKATFHSMRPQFETEYLSIEKQYIEEGWGIYDDTADLHRAICWSDGYYGDGSSVLQLYKVTKKMILLQDIIYPFQGFNKGIYFISVDISDGKVWGVSSAENYIGLFQYNLLTNSMEMLCKLDVPVFRLFQYGIVKKIKNKVIIAPYFYCGCFFCYDLTERKLDSYFPSGEGVLWSENSGVPAFSNVFQWKNFIIFFGNLNNSICVYDYEKDEWNTFPYLKDKGIDPIRINFPFQSGVLIGDIVYFPSESSNIIVKIELDDFRVSIHQLTTKMNIYNMDLADNAIWMISPDYVDKVIKFDFMTRKEKVVRLPLTYQSDRRIRNIYPYKNGLLIITIKRIIYYVGDSIIVINGMYEGDSWYEGILYAKDDSVYLYESSRRIIVEIDLNKMELKSYDFQYDINRDMVGGFVYQEQYSGVMLDALLRASKKEAKENMGLQDVSLSGSMIVKHVIRGGYKK